MAAGANPVQVSVGQVSKLTLYLQDLLVLLRLHTLEVRHFHHMRTVTSANALQSRS